MSVHGPDRSDPFSRFDDYDFRHWVAVQAADGAHDSVHKMFARHDVAGRNAWFAAPERRNEVAGYMEDLALARDLAVRSTARPRTPEALALPCRYTMIENAIRELASNLKPSLVARLAAAGVWT
ncbi:MAG TPA: hypothetical protein VIY30_08410, partial [Burkholderiaceae bacterium]